MVADRPSHVRPARLPRALVAAIALALAAASCSSSSPSRGSATTTATSTSSAAAARAPYAGPGPYAVGFTTLHLTGGRRVVVWYPAQPGQTAGHARESVDVASFLAPALQARIPKADRPLYPVDAYADAPAAADRGPFPLVLFSHGFAGFPEQSVTFTTHLASWGFVVAAPDHVERSLPGLLGTAAKGVPKSTDVQVLQATVTLLDAASRAKGVLAGTVDSKRLAVTGHSAGAIAAYQLAAADPRVRSWISLSVGFSDSTGRGTVPKAPDKPGMVMLGTKDGIISAADNRAVYAAMVPPKYLVEIAGAGHLVFSDLCLVGSAKGGIVSIAKALKLPIPANLLRLGSDGCGPGYPSTRLAFPAIDQLSVAFLRSTLGIDPKPVGLTTAAVAGLGASVTVQHG